MAGDACRLLPAAPGRDGGPRSAQAPIDVTVVLLDGGWISTSLGPIEVFHSAGLLWHDLQGQAGQPRFRVRTASLDGRPASCPYGVAMTPQCAIDQVGPTDVILVGSPGVGPIEQSAYDERLLQWLRDAHARGTHIAAVCAGVAYLAATGLLDGRRATTHWALAGRLQQRFPAVHWQTDKFVTEDGNLYCGGGVYAAIDLSLYLVEKFCGRDVALQSARALLVGMPRTSQESYGTVPLSRPHADERIRRAEEFLQLHFREPVSADMLAAHVGMSPRNLIRRFKEATGNLPNAYVQDLRVAAARELLEGSASSVQAIAAQVGYEDVAFFRALFRRQTGMTPADYRRRFGQLSIARGEPAAGPATAGVQAVETAGH